MKELENDGVHTSVILQKPDVSKSPKLWSAKYLETRTVPSNKSIWNMFSMPKVLAESPSATDKMEGRERHVQLSSSYLSDKEIQDYVTQETGYDRLRMMFQVSENGVKSEELQFIASNVANSGLAVFFIMSFLAGREHRNEFIRLHRATVYSTRFQASRRLSDSMFVYSMKEGGKWALKVSLFSTMFLGISQSIAVYRNKSSPLEYGIAAAMTGAFLKSTLGLKAVFSSCVLCGTAGLGVGMLIYGLLYATNETQEIRHQWKVHQMLQEEKENKGHLEPNHINVS